MEGGNDRLALFRQMKASLRGSEEYLLVGIDVAKQRHHAFFGTPNGKTLRKNLVFDNSLKGFEILRSLAAGLQKKWGQIYLLLIKTVTVIRKMVGRFIYC